MNVEATKHQRYKIINNEKGVKKKSIKIMKAYWNRKNVPNGYRKLQSADIWNLLRIQPKHIIFGNDTGKNDNQQWVYNINDNPVRKKFCLRFRRQSVKLSFWK